MQFDPFVIPFNIGLYFILVYVVVRSVIWFRDLSKPDKLRLQRGFFGMAFGMSLKEIFMESLIHRKILKTNLRLGYMHMSLAFGWFLLILFGTIEADIFGAKHLNAPYKAIFFRFFNPGHGRTGFEAAYGFLMDLILAFILSGLLIGDFKTVLFKNCRDEEDHPSEAHRQNCPYFTLAYFSKPSSGRKLYKRCIRDRQFSHRNTWEPGLQHSFLPSRWLILSGGFIPSL